MPVNQGTALQLGKEEIIKFNRVAVMSNSKVVLSNARRLDFDNKLKFDSVAKVAGPAVTRCATIYAAIHFENIYLFRRFGCL